jgi:hypothetical protein
MVESTKTTIQHHAPSEPVYEIRVRERLDEDCWVQWFEGMAVTVGENGETILTGPIADRAALHGLLTKIRDLALTLLSVNCVANRSREE